MVRALASHQWGPALNPGVDAICGLSFNLLLVLSFAQRGFPPGTPVFPFPQKPTFPNSNSTRNQVDEEPLCGCATSKSLFICLFIYIYLFIYLGFNYGEKVAEKLGFETDRWRVNPTDKLLSAFSERKDSTISKLIEASQEAGLPLLASELEKRFLQGS